VAALLGVGAVAMLLAAIGLLRMPDLFTRMHATAKIATLGVASLLLAVAVHFDDIAVTTKSLLVIAFFLITAPIAAHMIGRTAYIVRVTLWSGTVRDELHDRYDPETHELASRPEREHMGRFE